MTSAVMEQSVAVGITATQIDPRDETWPVDQPPYRVYFWDTDAACDEWELEGCDVDGALAWAADAADGRTFTVYSVVRGPGGLGPNEVALARLFGTDPTVP